MSSQQRTLGTVPQGDAFTHPPVQSAEILLDLAKIGEQIRAPAALNCWKRSLSCGVIEQRNIACLRAGDLGIDVIASFLQLRDARLRIAFAALAHLLEQFEQRQQPRLGADETAFGQRAEPRDGFLGGRRQIELRFVRTLGDKTCATSLCRCLAQSLR